MPIAMMASIFSWKIRPAMMVKRGGAKTSTARNLRRHCGRRSTRLAAPRKRIAAVPERRSLIRDRNRLKRVYFLRSRLALRLAGTTIRSLPGCDRRQENKSHDGGLEKEEVEDKARNVLAC